MLDPMDVVREAAGLEPHRGMELVPTMGALHEGHLSLVRRAAEAGPVVMTLFVNPTQFNERSDFDAYPRDESRDLELAEAAGAAVVFAPAPEVVYPPDADVPVPPLPTVAVEPGLEDAHRPGHFAGVVQVVARLMDLVRPVRGWFGEKDYQQLLVVRAMTGAARAADPARWPELEPDLPIRGVPTVREDDGLAMSSRNRLLDEDARRQAKGIFRALQSAHVAQHPASAEEIMAETLAAHDLEPEYAVVRDATTLGPCRGFERPARGLVAARVGGVRLIDNLAMTVWR